MYFICHIGLHIESSDDIRDCILTNSSIIIYIKDPVGVPHIMSYHRLVYHIISYHYYIISYYVISYYVISYHIISYRIILYHIISYHTMSYHIISYHIILYHTISYHATCKYTKLFFMIWYDMILFCSGLFSPQLGSQFSRVQPKLEESACRDGRRRKLPIKLSYQAGDVHFSFCMIII